MLNNTNKCNRNTSLQKRYWIDSHMDWAQTIHLPVVIASVYAHSIKFYLSSEKCMKTLLVGLFRSKRPQVECITGALHIWNLECDLWPHRKCRNGTTSLKSSDYVCLNTWVVNVGLVKAINFMIRMMYWSSAKSHKTGQTANDCTLTIVVIVALFGFPTPKIRNQQRRQYPIIFVPDSHIVRRFMMLCWPFTSCCWS